MVDASIGCRSAEDIAGELRVRTPSLEDFQPDRSVGYLESEPICPLKGCENRHDPVIPVQ
jgi:hypothetical protein